MAKKKNEVTAPAASAPAVVEKEKQLIPTIKVADDAMLAELQGVEGAGASNNVDDRGVPLLYIAQKGSPQLDKKKPEKYISNLEVGNVFNSLTGEDFDAEGDGVIAFPCFFRMNWNRWTPRDDGGGFHGSEPRDTPLLRGATVFKDPKNEDKERRDIMVLPDGDWLVQTAHYYCVLESTWQQIIIPMSSTNLGASRKWQSLIDAQKIQVPGGRIITKPAFHTRFNLRTVYTDDGDNQWYKYSVSIEGPNENAQLREFCKAFALACARNEIKAAQPMNEGGHGDGDDDIKV